MSDACPYLKIVGTTRFCTHQKFQTRHVADSRYPQPLHNNLCQILGCEQTSGSCTIRNEPSPTTHEIPTLDQLYQLSLPGKTGWGDSVAILIQRWLGIPPCASCLRRKLILNDLHRRWLTFSDRWLKRLRLRDKTKPTPRIALPKQPCGQQRNNGCGQNKNGQSQSSKQPESQLPIITFPKRVSSKPRVGYLMPAFYLGGVERYLLTMVENCNQVAFSGVAVAHNGFPYRPFADRIRAYGCPVVASKNGNWQQLAQALIDASDVVVVWGFTQKSPWAINDLNYQGKMVVVVSHGSAEFTTDVATYSQPFATHYLAVSEMAATAYPLELRDQVKVILNGVDTRWLVPQQGREATRAAWGVLEGETVVGYLGRTHQDKDPLAACRAVAELNRLGGKYRAVLVGGGFDQDQVRQEGYRLCRNKFIYVPPVETAGDTLAAFDVLMFASKHEGFGLVVAEAWLAGLPVVSTRVGVIPEAETTAGCPLVVPISQEATPEQLAQAVLDAKPFNTRPAKHYAEQFLTAQHMAYEFEKWVYESLGKYEQFRYNNQLIRV